MGGLSKLKGLADFHASVIDNDSDGHKKLISYHSNGYIFKQVGDDLNVGSDWEFLYLEKIDERIEKWYQEELYEDETVIYKKARYC